MSQHAVAATSSSGQPTTNLQAAACVPLLRQTVAVSIKRNQNRKNERRVVFWRCFLFAHDAVLDRCRAHFWIAVRILDHGFQHADYLVEILRHDWCTLQLRFDYVDGLLNSGRLLN